MAAKFQRDGLNLTWQLLEYVRNTTVNESPLQVALREETADLPLGQMMISPEQGQAMEFFAHLVQAKRIVEVGSFTGYSATWLAKALPADGVLMACDVSEEYTSIAARYWKQAGLDDRIKLRLAPAAETLQQLLEDGWAGTVDLMFIDADKIGYETYYEFGLKLLRPGGLFLFDNALWGGSVADGDNTEASTQALRAVNARVSQENHTWSALLTIGDGILGAVKRY